jgi:hypothetical protein
MEVFGWNPGGKQPRPAGLGWQPETYVAFPIEEGRNRRHQPGGGHISRDATLWSGRRLARYVLCRSS